MKPYHDLEAPYQDACAREGRYQEILEREIDELWREVQDPQKAETLLDDYESDPTGELANLLARYAELKKTKDYKAFWDRASLYFDSLVDSVAGIKAQRIYTNQ